MTEAIDELKQIARDLDNNGHYKAAAKVRRAAQLLTQSTREDGLAKAAVSNHGR